MKIGFLAYTTRQLDIYWANLKNIADCWWGVTRPNLYNLLSEIGIKNIVYHYDEHILNEKIKSGNKFVSLNPGHSEKIIAEKINPDIWIAQYPNNLSHLTKKAYWIQVFSSLPLKKYFFHKTLHNYDLLLLPGQYHKNEIIKRLNFKDNEGNRLKIIGWPCTDAFINGTYNKEIIIKKLGLDNTKKTLMYAPTWGAWNNNRLTYAHDKIFSRWFDNEIEVLKQLCSEVKTLKLNFIIKLHSLSTLYNDYRILELVDKYDILFIANETDRYTEDPYEYLYVTDILISDLSGIILEFMILDRPIIYIDPDEKLNVWEGSDMPKSFRAGYVVQTPNELISAIKDSLVFPDRFSDERMDISSMLVHGLDGKATDRGVQEIMSFAKNKRLI